jgi:hypothetical protein
MTHEDAMRDPFMTDPWRWFTHPEMPVRSALVNPMHLDALESIRKGEPAEEWEKRWRQEREGTWPPQEPS